MVDLTEKEELNLFQCYLRRGYTKQRRWTCPLLIAFTKAKTCAVSGKANPDAHHMVFRSVGNLASDLFLVPLLNGYHMELHHNLGTEKFESKYNINLTEQMVINIQEFIDSLIEMTQEQRAYIATLEARVHELEGQSINPPSF